MNKESLAPYDRDNFDSDFLCPTCGEVLYEQEGEEHWEGCLNPACPGCPHGLEVQTDLLAAGAPQLHEELSAEESRLREEIQHWDHGALASRAHHFRKSLISAFFKGHAMPIREFLAVGDLLQLVSQEAPRGALNDELRFHVLIDAMKRLAVILNMLEDLSSGRHRWASGDRLLTLKYAFAYARSLAAYGLVSSAARGPVPGVFEYDRLEGAVTRDVDLGQMRDFAEFFDSMWQFSVQANMALRGHERTAQQYAYLLDDIDMSILAEWAVKPDDRTHTLNEDRYVSGLKDHYAKYGDGTRDAHDFVRDYADGIRLVPIFVRVPQGLLIDRPTALYFMLLIAGRPERRLGSRGARARSRLNRFKGLVAPRFEQWIRTEMRDRGFRGPMEPIRPLKKGYEYDIAMISEDRRMIVLADAKYRDILPSAMTAENLVRQEILGSDGLRKHARQQQKRLDFFNREPDLFREYLKPQREWSAYGVTACLLMKHEPVISRYREVRVMWARAFLDSFALVA